MEQSVFLTLFNHPSSFDQRNKLFFPLFLWRKEKRQKKHPPLSVLPLYGEAQLKIADTANFRFIKVKSGIKARFLQYLSAYARTLMHIPEKLPAPSGEG